MREMYAKYQNKYRLGSKMAPDCCITVNGVIVMVLMHQCVRYTGHLEQYAAFWTVCRGTSRPLTLTSTEETGHVWLLFPISAIESDFWDKVIRDSDPWFCLQCSVGQCWFWLHTQWFHSPWSAFTPPTTNEPDGRGVSNNVSSGWIFPLRSVYRVDREVRSLGSECGGEERIRGLMKPAQGAHTWLFLQAGHRAAEHQQSGANRVDGWTVIRTGNYGPPHLQHLSKGRWNRTSSLIL